MSPNHELPSARFGQQNVVRHVVRCRKLTFRAAAPLRLGDVDIGVHDDVLGGCGLGDIVPDLETGSILCPARILFDDLLSHASAIGVAQSIDHGNFERNVLALTVVDLVNHLDRIGPAMVLVWTS